MRTLILSLVGIPFLLLLLVGLLRPSLLVGSGAVEASLVWTMIGSMLGYLGFVFSMVAVLEVRRLSNRYFAKQRLPELRKQLEGIAKAMTDASDLTFHEIRAERFVSESKVAIRQLKGVNSLSFAAVVKQAEVDHSNLEALLLKDNNMNGSVKDYLEYWNLVRVITELVDEIKAHEKGALARL